MTGAELRMRRLLCTPARAAALGADAVVMYLLFGVAEGGTFAHNLSAIGRAVQRRTTSACRSSPRWSPGAPRRPTATTPRLRGEGWAEIEANLIHYKQVLLTGSANSRRADYETALRLIESGRIDTASMVTHRFPLSAVTDAIAAVTTGAAIKVAVLP
jgi:hypothetical protein